MKITIHSTSANPDTFNHYFDTFVYEKDITEYDYYMVAKIVDSCIQECTGSVIKNISVE